ncbi:hypothetical protein WR25_17533 [Diploscapter pachys]|uniref:Uncharacterized protein n=1 Tax=Diploscapter pachys TaxID=2018661 RepID=A0A2A2KD12_9BILA|nr:hypothetical protein WR25_17533 [Diploscapter pachys]
MLEGFMLMAQGPVPDSFVNFRQCVRHHVRQQQRANRRHEQPGQVEQGQPCRRQRLLTFQRLPGVRISCRHSQEARIFAYPLQLL